MKEENTQANCGLLFEANLSYTYLYAVRYPFYVVSLINILKAVLFCVSIVVYPLVTSKPHKVFTVYPLLRDSQH